MSRASARKDTKNVEASPGEENGELQNRLQALAFDQDSTTNISDVCPICKQTRYFKKDLRFLINPECYHKMCESCVDRIFSQGPAPCPVAGCAKTLRKQRFRSATFADLRVEREVDIRRRVAAIFNRRESEFNTLLDYNNYLEDVEAMTFNLIYNIDVPTTEAKLAAYAKQNSSDIAQNEAISAQEHASSEAQAAAQKEQAKLRRIAAQREEDDERREREEGRREIIDKIATSHDDPDRIARDSRKVVLKKSSARQTAAERMRQQEGVQVDNGAAPTYTIAGLKPIIAPEPEKVYDPFGGYVMKSEYYTLQKRYENPYFERGVRTDAKILAGGYELGEYCARALLEGFAGLGVFVEEEVAGRDSAGSKEVGTVSAAAAAGDGDGDESD